MYYTKIKKEKVKIKRERRDKRRELGEPGRGEIYVYNDTVATSCRSLLLIK
tara:strand:- start:230 stop:382 length:153 start_codon:yes stop_codon:yes gene_type:complete